MKTPEPKATQAAQEPGWIRPVLPPDGEGNFLEDHPFDLVRTPLTDAVFVEQVTIPMRDGVTLAGTVFRPLSAPSFR
jgi:uncharacterized protein